MRAQLEALKRSIEEAKAAPAYAPMAKARAAERAVELAAELLELIVLRLERDHDEEWAAFKEITKKENQ